MTAPLGSCSLFEGLSPDVLSRLEALATRKTFGDGEHPFVIGQEADRMYVVLQGKVDLCIPLSIQGAIEDVRIETKEPGGTLGWSAFVNPYRFRLTARVAGGAELAVFSRPELQGLFESAPEIGYAFMERIAGVIAQRLLAVQALWARELQRVVEGEQALPPEAQSADVST